jgi:hypothetical protein
MWLGTYKVRNEIKTKRNEINENETKRNEMATTKSKYYDHIVLLYLESRKMSLSVDYFCLFLPIYYCSYLHRYMIKKVQVLSKYCYLYFTWELISAYTVCDWVPIKCETKSTKTKRNEINENERKRNEINENETKRNQRNGSEMKRNQRICFSVKSYTLVKE